MILILARLQWMTVKGRVIRSMRLLRQPKYLVGTLVGIGWMGFWVLRPLLRAKYPAGIPSTAHSFAAVLPTMHRVVAIMATLLMPLAWLLPFAKLGLPFREAELTMLLQAPLTRRQVVHYGLLKSEVGVLISALIVSTFLLRASPMAWPLSFLGTWLVFEFLHLNGKWRALSVVSLRGRRLPLTIGLLIFFAVLLSSLAQFVSRVAAEWHASNYNDAVAALAALPWPPLTVALTAPAWWLMAPMFAESGTAFAISLVPLILAVVVQREIVLRTKVRFEESALEQAKARDSKAARLPRVTKRRAFARAKGPFDLTGPGMPEAAVLWKNSMRVSRLPWIWIFCAGAAFLVALAVVPAALRVPDFLYALLAIFGTVLVIVQPLVGGMAWHNDLRTELAHVEAVRTWPVAPARFMLAEVASPAVMTFAGSTFGAGILLACYYGIRLRQLFTGEPTDMHLLPQSGAVLGVANDVAAALMFLSVLPLTAALAFLSSALQNLAVLLVPAWMVHTVDRSRGIAAFGQRMISSFALGLTFMLSLLPSAALVGIALLAQRALGIPWSAWALPFWGILGAIPPVLMAGLMLRVATPLWERLDPAEELLEIGR